MKLISVRRFGPACLFLLVSCLSGHPADTNALNLRAMTYNLRFASNARPNAWPDRRPVAVHLIQKTAPDLIGTQEGLSGQLQDLAADLPAYRWIGTGRDGNNQGEFMAIFYRHDRFEPTATNHFWLSDTPEIPGSTTWGNVNRRMVTWVQFRERATGREFAFWNTHLDHQVEQARQKGAALILERLQRLDPKVPAILVGDFNCAGGNSRAHDIFVKEGGLTDTWPQAAQRINETLNSFHGYESPRNAGERIDWILLRGKAQVSRAEVLNFSEDGQYPSDHFPVMVELTF
jgi:endonuclease/exonuclease/phosphatase family metal-dependent hydrolase